MCLFVSSFSKFPIFSTFQLFFCSICGIERKDEDEKRRSEEKFFLLWIKISPFQFRIHANSAGFKNRIFLLSSMHRSLVRSNGRSCFLFLGKEMFCYSASTVPWLALLPSSAHALLLKVEIGEMHLGSQKKEGHLDATSPRLPFRR